ncbi:MAG TPA: hypothetical protein VNT54_11480, partial [Solirubrobacteraceae bacterium]|nr:hypothetical protein [Solirubrobacteraceae bacterium]
MTRASRLSTTDILQGAGAAAGTAAIVYVVGGMVMWLRFRKAGLPADQAVALMERQQLLVVGLRLMVLPALLTGALAWLVMRRRARRTVTLPDDLRTGLKAALAVVAVALALLLPLSFASATWVLAALLVVGYLRYERRPVPENDDAGTGTPAPAPAPAGGGGGSGRLATARARLTAALTWSKERWGLARPHL